MTLKTGVMAKYLPSVICNSDFEAYLMLYSALQVYKPDTSWLKIKYNACWDASVLLSRCFISYSFHALETYTLY